MPTPLEEIGSPTIGDGIDFGIQTSGENNRIVTRRYKMRVTDRSAYTVQLINPTLFDPVFTSAVIIGQRIMPIPGNKVDCVLERIFAEIPTEWDDYPEEVVTFPGVQPSPFYSGGGAFAFRSTQRSRTRTVRVHRSYFLSNPQRIPRVEELIPVDKMGNDVGVLTSETNPTSDYYIALAKANQEFVYRCRVRRWRGDIWVRETIHARAE